MKTWQITLLVVIVLGVIGGIFWLTRDTSNSNSNTETNSQTDNIENSSNANTAATQNNNSNNSNSNNQVMSDQYSAKKYVTLSVQGFGDIKIEMYPQDAPKTVENFERLTDKGYYNGLTFHRISKGFVIQGGDPTGTGSGGDSIWGGEFADELNPNTPSYKAGYVKGVLAMANRGPNTNTSQFFIMLGDTPLPHNYTIFGKVIAGQDVVDKIGAVDINPQMGPTDGTPKQKIVITKAVTSDN